MFAFSKEKIRRTEKAFLNILGGWKLFLICENPLLSHNNNIPTCQEEIPKYDFKVQRDLNLFLDSLQTKILSEWGIAVELMLKKMPSHVTLVKQEQPAVSSSVRSYMIQYLQHSSAEVRLISHIHQGGGFITLNIALLSTVISQL